MINMYNTELDQNSLDEFMKEIYNRNIIVGKDFYIIDSLGKIHDVVISKINMYGRLINVYDLLDSKYINVYPYQLKKE
ncbi:hypothetical protein FPHOBKDP_00126 [Listeria phage LPJP1]|nr:hypothetical protein FPHOBKDP_00126 [Listeria phage LPJP1]